MFINVRRIYLKYNLLSELAIIKTIGSLGLMDADRDTPEKGMRPNWTYMCYKGMI